MTEHEQQKALFDWLDSVAVMRWPQHTVGGKFMAFAVPNAAKRSPQLAAWMKAEGMRAGVPDVCIPIPSGKYCGLWLEMKVGNNKETPAQREWLIALESHGHKTIVCYDYRTGIDIIERYLNGVL